MALPVLLAGPRRWRFARLVANGILQALLAVALTQLVKRCFDQLVVRDGAAPSAELAPWVMLALAALLLSAWLRWKSHVDAERLGQGYVHALRLKLFRHLTRVGPQGLAGFSRGAVLLRFVGDLTAIRNWVSLGLARLTVSGLTVLVTLALLAGIEPLISVVVGLSALAAAALSLALGPGLRRRTREVRRQRGRLAANLNDRIAHLNVIDSFGQQQREQRRFRRQSRQVRDRLVERASSIGLLRALTEASAGLAGLSALLAGIGLVNGGSATAGSVVAAMLIAGLLTPRLQELGRVYEYWTGYQVAREKQLQLLRTRSPLPAVSGERSLTLPEQAEPTLTLTEVQGGGVQGPVDVRIPPGSRVCIYGPNGAGKTSLLRVMAGLEPVTGGEVLLDGMPVTGLEAADRAAVFAMVSPDLPLLRGSLRFNLTYGSGSARVSDSALDAALERCGLQKLVQRLPRGLDQRIGDRHDTLSTGERARLVLARALLSRPRILLLDEADANLDAPSRRALARTIAGFEGTVIYTTHDRDQARAADRVLVMGGGRLRAQGSWAQVEKELAVTPPGQGRLPVCPLAG